MKPIQLSTQITVLDVPAPEWIKHHPDLSPHWGELIICAKKYGRITQYEPGATITTTPGDLYLVINGCLIASTNPLSVPDAPIYISALKRGDIITPDICRKIPISLSARTNTTVLCIHSGSINDFAAEVSNSGQFLASLNIELAQKYAEAAQSLLLKDQDRILRVIANLATHPESKDTVDGIQIEIRREDVRKYAGVQIRSATRAFAGLSDSGVIKFNGYKRIYYNKAGHK